ncbi:uncharacterized protein [Palaemon carinicauda]|uniref:uncharacterized protein n=1 Tax=Palaemon carinicauda TaxID=392227 RepID=UPI0035B5F572
MVPYAAARWPSLREAAHEDSIARSFPSDLCRAKLSPSIDHNSVKKIKNTKNNFHDSKKVEAMRGTYIPTKWVREERSQQETFTSGSSPPTRRGSQKMVLSLLEVRKWNLIPIKFYRVHMEEVWLPKTFMSDNGLEFMNKVKKSVQDMMKIEHFPLTAYRPSANSFVELYNRGAVRILLHLVADDPLYWHAMLHTPELDLNIADNASFRDTPFFLVYEQGPVLPYTVLINSQQLLNLLWRVMDCTKRFLNRANEKKAQSNRTIKVFVGDRVYLKRLQPRNQKLEPVYLGPYQVKMVKSNTVVI